MAEAPAGEKWVYLFNEGSAAMRDLLGGKGAGLAEMANAGLPVPPGFTITTAACRAYYDGAEQFPPGLWEQTLAALGAVERQSGKRFGDPANPLLVAVRSGSAFSMPGMMDTVLNLGLNEETLAGLIGLTGDERFAVDAYRRFRAMFGKIVLGVTPASAAVPADPYEQLRLAIRAVFASWNNRRAATYRELNGIPHELGTAVSVVTMVFGNMGDDSGTGVAFTRDPASGAKALYGEFLANAQGEDVVAGIRTPQRIEQLAALLPDVYRQLAAIAAQLERHYRDAQDMEFTVERGKLYMLQTRTAQRTAAAAVKMAVDMANEGLISRHEALLRVQPEQVAQLLLPRFDPRAKAAAIDGGRLLARGLNASPGAASGQAVFDADRAVEAAAAGRPVILVRHETNPDDVHGMVAALGVLTARGGATSHAAVVARGMGKPCVSGTEALHVDNEQRLFSANGVVIREGDDISIDGGSGEVFAGRMATVEARFEDERELVELLAWADGARRLGIWANADYPGDAALALRFGAEGIGLCRTEHMFFERERLPVMRRMILCAAEASRVLSAASRARQALARAGAAEYEQAASKLEAREQEVAASAEVREYLDTLRQLEEFQFADFLGIFRAMGSRPVVIRLLDPPLHEFLPPYEQLLAEVSEMRGRGETWSAAYREKERMLGVVSGMREQNPMLGLRGDRLGVLYPHIYEMQVRAILSAAAQLHGAGPALAPEIMIPLTGTFNELKLMRELVDRVAAQVRQATGTDVPFRFGTMIEVPRAGLVAGQLAGLAEFFSFGTNDLTQTTFGYSRDDAEGKFLLEYVNLGVLGANPFQTLDRDGVGRLIGLAVGEGRATRPDLKVGICGEHGGDPASIAFCEQAGLTYVSCSPYRVPVARLAAAHAAFNAGPLAGNRAVR